MGASSCCASRTPTACGSTPEAVSAIIDGLDWLGLAWDGEIVHQSARAPRHAEVARQLLAAGRAYYCYCTPAELEAMRERARAEKRSVRYDGTWRDRDPSEAPAGVAPAIRLKAPQHGSTTIHDHVQGEVTVANTELDDLIILRADGTPTYNLSVVVDDHDMGITHVIRGDDHLNNAFRQKQIYDALGWAVPEFAHVPLIHGPDGAKLSKRHGALGDRRLSRARLSAGGACAIICSASAGAMATTRSSRPNRRSSGSISTPSAAPRRGSISPSSTV